MIPRGLQIEAFLVALAQELKSMGPDAFALHESSPLWPADDVLLARLEIATQLYSGPGKSVTKEFKLAAKEAGLPFLNSWHISREQGIKRKAKRIDDTKAGQLLVAMDLDEYFEDVYGKAPPVINKAVLKAWSFLSREFVKATKEHLFVTSPAADPKRVLCKTELPTAYKQKRHTDLNAVPWDKAAKVKGRTQQARLAALTGIRLAWREAREECAKGSPNAARAVLLHQTMLAQYKLARRNSLRHARKAIAPVYRPSAKEHVAKIIKKIQAVPCAA